MNILNIIISLSPFIVSLPFTLLDINKFKKEEEVALWQPPGFVFGIVWPILYVLLFIFNYSLLSKNISKVVTNSLRTQILIESFLQGFWLYIFRFNDDGRTQLQYSNGVIILFFSILVTYYRINFVYGSKSTRLLYYYLPYVLWIHFAFILNLQLAFNITKRA